VISKACTYHEEEPTVREGACAERNRRILFGTRFVCLDTVRLDWGLILRDLTSSEGNKDNNP
jgi:hypothetical protein